jgi:Domain of unknown function (DUF5642)
MILVAAASAGTLAACSSGGADKPAGDIARVAQLKSSFGPEFTFTEVPTAGVDPKFLAAQKLPDGLKFEPADCAKFAAGPQTPPDLKGNMAALTAEGAGNRFIVIALETSKPMPMVEPTDNCKKISVAGGAVRGVVEVVPAPQIPDAQTQAVHRVLQATVDGKTQIGEVYTYRALFGDYQAIVTANPLVLPGQPVVAVDTARAATLLSSAVAAIRQSG